MDTLSRPPPLTVEERRRVYSEPLGQAARERGIDKAEANAAGAWLDKAYEALARLASTRVNFTSDDLWQLVGDPPGDTRALGAVLRRGARERLCETTGDFVKSRRAICHRRPVAVWRSLYKPQETTR